MGLSRVDIRLSIESNRAPIDTTNRSVASSAAAASRDAFSVLRSTSLRSRLFVCFARNVAVLVHLSWLLCAFREAFGLHRRAYASTDETSASLTEIKARVQPHGGPLPPVWCLADPSLATSVELLRGLSRLRRCTMGDPLKLSHV